MGRTSSTSSAGTDRPEPAQSRPGDAADAAASREPTTGKRRRISLACQACRTRKSRCDGARPKCSYCADLNFDCVYLQSASSSNVIIGKEYLGTLEERLKVAEDNIKQLRDGQSRSVKQIRFDDEKPAVRTNVECHTERGRPGGLRNGAVEVNSDDVQDSSDLEDETDGMGSIVFSAEQDCGFFGPSSNIAFTRHIARAVAQVTNVDQSCFAVGPDQVDAGVMSVSQPPSPSPYSSSKRPNGVDRGQINIYALPPEDETRELIAQYFANTGLLFPYIHAGAFMETYEAMKRSNFRKVRRTWLGLLNIVMALSTSTMVRDNLTAEMRAKESDVYYRRAVGLCDKLIMRGTSIEIVQYLLVMGKYLQGTQKSVETWMVHGLAVKAALQLGLHSAEASKRFSPLDQEVRKRTWYGCVLLDRTLSMTFGRPAAIPDDYVRLDLPCSIGNAGLPSMINDERLVVSVSFFNATITLYKIMWNVINLSYSGNIGSDPHISVFDTVSRLFQMEQLLIEWKRQLPPTLTLRQSGDFVSAPSPQDPVASSLERFPVILTLRYHNLRVLLHRPVLVKFLDITGQTSRGLDTQELSLLQQIGSNSIQICVQSSMEIIGIVCALAAGPRRAWLGAWWFSLYYTYNAALVIFAALLIIQDQQISGSVLPFLPVSTQELEKCLHDALAALRQLDWKNRTVERCANFLQQLANVLEALSSPSHATSGTNGTPAPYQFHQFHGNANGHGLVRDYGIPHGYMNSIISNASPLGMDLGEYMLEDDIEFLNQIASTGLLSSMHKGPEVAICNGIPTA